MKKDVRKSRTAALFAYEGLDRVIHEHARLSIVTSLATHAAGLTFSDLKEFCALTDGNLSRHLQVLEREGLITVFKGTERNRPLTLCRISADGRKRYMDYLGVLERVINDAADAGRQSATLVDAAKSARQ